MSIGGEHSACRRCGYKRGFHAVALQGGRLLARFHSRDPEDILHWCQALGARPLVWMPRAGGAIQVMQDWPSASLPRVGFAALLRQRESVGSATSSTAGCVIGAKLYELIKSHYPLFRRGRVALPICFETFPHAVACELDGSVVSAKEKRKVRRKVLHLAGVDTSDLANIDKIDAALCAVVADYLVARKVQTCGDLNEGFIVLPATAEFCKARA